MTFVWPPTNRFPVEETVADRDVNAGVPAMLTLIPVSRIVKGAVPLAGGTTGILSRLPLTWVRAFIAVGPEITVLSESTTVTVAPVTVVIGTP